MKLLSHVQPAKFWAYNAHQLIMRAIPWHTAGSHATITSDLYFVLKNSQIWCDFCTCADLLSQPMHALSNIKMAGQDIVKTLEYSPVVKIPESEGLLVQQCSARLGEYGLTLWVVSILMYDQEFHHKKLFFPLFFVSCHMAANIVASRHPNIQSIMFV